MCLCVCGCLVLMCHSYVELSVYGVLFKVVNSKTPILGQEIMSPVCFPNYSMVLYERELIS